MKLPNGQDLRNFIRNGNWGLKLLALLLAIVIYLAIRSENAGSMHVLRVPREIILNEAAATHEKTTTETMTEITTSNDGTTDKPN